jgi:hypothetical protein
MGGPNLNHLGWSIPVFLNPSKGRMTVEHLRTSAIIAWIGEVLDMGFDLSPTVRLTLSIVRLSMNVRF